MPGILPVRTITWEELRGKKIGVDFSNCAYQFLSSIRRPDGTPLMDSKGNITSHLQGLFSRTLNLINKGIKICYIFDGRPPLLKQYEREEREHRKRVAEERLQKAMDEEDIESMKKYSMQLSRLDTEMISESKELLDAMGIAVIQAPSEGESEAAYLAKKKAYASASQDYDSLLFGAPKLIQNLTLARKRKTPTGYVDINIDKEGTVNELRKSFSKALGFAVNISYTSPDTIKFLIQRAGRQEMALEKLAEETRPSEAESEKKEEEEKLYNFNFAIPEKDPNPGMKSIEIPSIRYDSPIVISDNGDKAVDYGAWHYPSNHSMDGEAIFLCHRRYFKAFDPKSCWNLDKVKPGDSLFVNYSDGSQSFYKVDSVSVAAGSDINIYHASSDSKIKLISCAKENGRIGSNSHRIIVIASLVE